VEQRAERSWPWYLTRASGIIAGVSLIALLVSGIGSVTGHFFRILEPLTAWATHRAIGIVFASSIVIHMATLLFDHFVPFSLVEILVPWASDYRSVEFMGMNFGSLFVALGVIAFYGALVVVVTSLLWVDKKPHRWKIYHYLSYVILIAVFFHGLMLGTDLGTGIGRILWYLGGILVLIAVAVRLRRARSI
jgi:predicted ferric reductase